MSVPCGHCGGSGRVSRKVLSGKKPCYQCDGTGQQPDMWDHAYAAREAYRDAADEWMDRRDPDYGWGAELEAGHETPGEWAEDWAHGDGLDWDP